MPAPRGQFLLGSWNVRSLYAPGRLDLVLQDAADHHLKLLAVQETWWPTPSDFRKGEYHIYSTGAAPDDPRHRKGVAFMIRRSLDSCVLGHKVVSPSHNS